MDYFDLAARHVDAYMAANCDDTEFDGIDYDALGEDYQEDLKGAITALVAFINMTPGAAEGLGIEHR